MTVDMRHLEKYMKLQMLTHCPKCEWTGTKVATLKVYNTDNTDYWEASQCPACGNAVEGELEDLGYILVIDKEQSK